ncbi:COX15/CtaA family protein [Bacteroidia bacterium]|nr:COX15/CtaA family protein [Bacteroidia bacterium]
MVFTPQFYRKAGWLTCFSIFLLVLAGGIVRATGSGMGCPDWPTCFGTYIPPTHENQLPENYQDIFLQKRLAKIDRYVKTLNAFGLTKQADKIANDQSIREAEKFSVVTTWIEALNRYLGALTGIFALVALLSSIQFIRNQASIFIFTLLGVIAVIINGWMGSVVVATNLMQGPITIHYLAAFIAAGLFMWPVIIHTTKEEGVSKKVKSALLILFGIIILQSITGTWSRETVDSIAKSNQLTDAANHLNLTAMGFVFVIHRYLSLIVIGLGIYLYRNAKHPAYQKWIRAFLIIAFAQVIAGSINILFVLPPFAQAFHIFAGGIMLGISMYLAFKTLKRTKIAS